MGPSIQDDLFRNEESVRATIGRHFQNREIDAAEAIADVAITRFPGSAGLHIQHALIPFYRNDMDTMAARMSGVLTSFPGWAPAYRWSGHALRRLKRFPEAAAILDVGLALHPEDADMLIERGWVATEGGKFAEASSIWRLVRTIAPQRTEGYWAGARVALRLGDQDLAEMLCRRGYDRFPQDRFILLFRGLVANDRGDWEEAGRRWEQAKSLHPGMQEILHGIRAYEAGKDGIRAAAGGPIDIFRNADTACFTIVQHFQRKAFDEAEALAEAAILRFPDDANVHTQHALVPLYREELDAAIPRLATVVERFPEWPAGRRWLGSALRRAKRFDEAEIALAKGLALQPDNVEILIERGYLSQDLARFAEALPIWERVRALSPERAEGWSSATMAALRVGDLDAAERLGEQGYERFPENALVLIHRGLVATRRQEWDKAAHRWAEAKAAFPNMPQVLNGIGEYEANRALEGMDENLSSLEKPSGSIDSEIARLVGRFESLGSNCEVGIVQRMAGLEPLGLLRWASIRPHHLVAMLDSDFAGVGDPEHVVVRINNNGEWHMRDPRYFGMHTFIHGTQMDEAEVHRSCVRRSRFLADKLRQDLLNSEKYFVYKHHVGPLQIEEIDAMFAAIRRYGPGNLLCVHKAEGEENRRVRMLRDGLLLATMPELTSHATSGIKRIDIWHRIFREAQALLNGEAVA